jgi:hypothetical protein
MPQRDFLEAVRAKKSDVTLQALCDRLSAERGVKADTSMMSRFFRRLGVTFKKTYGPPRSQGALARLAADPVCFNVSGLGGSFSRPRWRYARSGPHKTHGVERRFLKSGFRTAVRL